MNILKSSLILSITIFLYSFPLFLRELGIELFLTSGLGKEVVSNSRSTRLIKKVPMDDGQFDWNGKDGTITFRCIR